MTARTAKARWSLLVGFAALLAAGRASAQTTTCTVDTDCPGTVCGSQVCAHDSGGIRCVDQGALGSSGSEGWCADSNGVAQDANCKCRSFGATGSGGSGTGTGGATGSAGSGGGGGGGCSIAGAPSLGGSLGMALLAAALLRRRGRRRV
jgi:hypothetical protein